MQLDEAQVKQFEEDGFLVVEDLLSAPQVDELKLHIEQIADGRLPFPQESLEWEPGTELQDRGMMSLRKINSCAAHDPFFVEHSSKPAILDVIESLLGSDIKLFGDQAFIKPPGGSEENLPSGLCLFRHRTEGDHHLLGGDGRRNT